MADIWAKQSQHVACLQDPPSVKLYIKVSTTKKGGLELPVYKCARGSTSLENFHLHLARFIPGTLAMYTNFQVYLLGGTFRWNADRAAEAVTTSSSKGTVIPRTYNGPLKEQNILWKELCGKPFFPNFQPPAKYTGELVGVQYLYDQTGQELSDSARTRYQLEDDRNINQQVDDNDDDEGFVDLQQPFITPPEETAPLEPLSVTTRPILHIPSEEANRQVQMDTVIEGLEPPKETNMPTASNVHVTPSTSMEESSPEDQSSDVLGPDNVPGYDKVIELADFLVELRNVSALRLKQIKQLTCLWNNLSSFDKKRTVFPRRYTKKAWSGKFDGRGKHVAPGVKTITKRLIANQSPAQWPNCNRYTEATCELLLKIFPGDQRRMGIPKNSWTLVLTAFHNIRKVIINSTKAMKETEIQLPMLNKKTLGQWYNKEDKAQEQKVLLQGLNMPKPVMTASGLPQARQKPAALPSSDAPRFTFKANPCTAGMAQKTSRKRKHPTSVSELSVIIQPSVASQPSAASGSSTDIQSSAASRSSTDIQTSAASRSSAVIQPSVAIQPFATIQTPITMSRTTPPAVIRSPVMNQQQLIILPSQPSYSQVSTQPSQTNSKKSRTHTNPEYIRCSKCGQNRKNSPTHQTYLFNIFCEVSESITFEEWLNLTKEEMAQKRKLKKERKLKDSKK